MTMSQSKISCLINQRIEKKRAGGAVCLAVILNEGKVQEKKI